VERDIALGAPPLAAAAGRLATGDFASPTSVRDVQTHGPGTPTPAPVRRKP
jgi:hypothetical protein